MKKSMAILSMLIIVAALLALGCAGRNNASTSTATPVPPAGSITATPVAGPMVTVGPDNNSSTYIDPSLADITNESDESVPDEG